MWSQYSKLSRIQTFAANIFCIVEFLFFLHFTDSIHGRADFTSLSTHVHLNNLEIVIIVF